MLPQRPPRAVHCARGLLFTAHHQIPRCGDAQQQAYMAAGRVPGNGSSTVRPMRVEEGQAAGMQ